MTRGQRALLLAIIVTAEPDAVRAQSDSSLRVQFGAFVDVYYAHDFGRPATLDRAFTTQAARHSEFNVNLAHVDARVTGDRVRGRIALQAGTSVQANYAAEPGVGAVSGPDLSRHIQEASVGYHLAPRLWIDAGILFAPFGSEGWISSENWTYTRSLIADNSPYYQSGVKATWLATERLSVQTHVINGWQNISETNSDKALVMRVDYALLDRLSVGYGGFVGNEQPDSVPSAVRWFHELTSRLRLSPRLEVSGTLDYGQQAKSAKRPESEWRGGAILARYTLAQNAWLAARAEAYSDPGQVIVTTGQPYGLRARGGSLNLDVAPQPTLLWRIELRGLHSTEPLFADRTSRNGSADRNWVIVSSIALRVQ